MVSSGLKNTHDSIEVTENAIISQYYLPKTPSKSERTKRTLRVYVAEFIGTLFLVLFGCGVIAQTTFNSAAKGSSFLSVNLGWGLGLTLGVLIAGPISGGHLNPAVTLAKALFREFSWRQVPGYMLSQTLGGFFGAALVYMIYWPLFPKLDQGTRLTVGRKGTAGIFATYSQPKVPNYSSFITETFLTSILMIGIMVITNKKNKLPNWGAALSLGLLITAIGMCLGFTTGYSMNPARDFGPRVFTAMAGWGESVFVVKGYYFWIPVIGPFLGAPLGMAIYKYLIDL